MSVTKESMLEWHRTLSLITRDVVLQIRRGSVRKSELEHLTKSLDELSGEIKDALAGGQRDFTPPPAQGKIIA